MTDETTSRRADTHAHPAGRQGRPDARGAGRAGRGRGGPQRRRGQRCGGDASRSSVRSGRTRPVRCVQRTSTGPTSGAGRPSAADHAQGSAGRLLRRLDLDGSRPGCSARPGGTVGLRGLRPRPARGRRRRRAAGGSPRRRPARGARRGPRPAHHDARGLLLRAVGGLRRHPRRRGGLVPDRVRRFAPLAGTDVHQGEAGCPAPARVRTRGHGRPVAERRRRGVLPVRRAAE